MLLEIAQRNLSLDEDLLFRKAALGKIKGETTGYVSIDKPWLKHHSEEQLRAEFTPMSMYQRMEKCNAEHFSYYALSFFGTRITFRKLLAQIEITAKALCQLGGKKGDIVMMGMPNTPEAIYIFYALNKIGAVLNSFDSGTSVNEKKRLYRLPR